MRCIRQVMRMAGNITPKQILLAEGEDRGGLMWKRQKVVHRSVKNEKKCK